jgi:hypothetical protein
MDQSFHEQFELPLSVDETRRRLSIESTTRFFEAFIQRKQVGSNRRMKHLISVLPGISAFVARRLAHHAVAL